MKNLPRRRYYWRAVVSLGRSLWIWVVGILAGLLTVGTGFFDWEITPLVRSLLWLLVLIGLVWIPIQRIAALLSEREPGPRFREDAENIADSLSRIIVPKDLDSTQARQQVIDAVVLQQRLVVRLIFRAQHENELAIELPLRGDTELTYWFDLAKFGAQEWPEAVIALEDLGKIVRDSLGHESLEIKNESVRHLPEHARGLVVAIARHCFRGE